MEQRYETVETRKCIGGNMQIGSVVRHRIDGNIGIVVEVYGDHLHPIIAVDYDGVVWRTYKHKVEVICK